jgi:hypothetical protein
MIVLGLSASVFATSILAAVIVLCFIDIDRHPATCPVF